MKTAIQLVDRLVNVLALGSGILMAFLTALVTYSIFSRYVFNVPIQATSQLTGLIFAWLVFLAAVSVTHNQDNIAITYFRDKLPSKTPRIAEIVSKITMLVFSVYILISSYSLASAMQAQIIPNLDISISWLYIATVVGFGAITIVLLLQIIGDIFYPETRKVMGEDLEAEIEEHKLEPGSAL